MKLIGQSALETIIYSGLLLVFFAIIIMIYAKSIDESNNFDNFLKAKAICNQVAQAVNYVATSYDNVSKVVELPDQINGINYSLNFYSGINLLQISELFMANDAGSQRNPSRVFASCHYATRNVYSLNYLKNFSVFSKVFRIRKVDNSVIVGG
ncbi:MAG: hypothetical protein N3E37_00555 [Candidatus Micrarchaeota archaeon]|nr:hypothetical protein [Candidatus Micrarchaeota archaeon]